MTSEKTITAVVRLHDRVIENVPVLNPGDWFGKVWLLEVGGGYDSLYLVAEADNASDAIDVLADNYQYGPNIHITGSDLADYGTDCTGCSNATHPKGKHWQCEDGSIVTDPERGKYLSEPYFGGNCCMPCNLDNLMIHGDDRTGFAGITYSVPGVDQLVKPEDLDSAVEARDNPEDESDD